MISDAVAIVVLMSLVLLSTSITLSVFPNTIFVPIDPRYQIANLSPINSSNMCLCRCYNISICFTVTYVAANRTCILYFAQLTQGHLQSVPANVNASVYSFGNRNLTGELETRFVRLMNTCEDCPGLMSLRNIQKLGESHLAPRPHGVKNSIDLSHCTSTFTIKL